MPNGSEYQPVVGHHAGWGLITSPFRPQPYNLAPGATDTMQVRVREKIDVHGVGTDVVEMVGVFTVRRDHPRPTNGGEVRRGGRARAAERPEEMKWPQAEIKAEFRTLELVGESPVFGTVRARLDPQQIAQATVSPGEAGSVAMACKAEMFPIIELPELGLELNTGGEPVSLASKVVQVPPVGDVARSENSVSLRDSNGEVLGELVSSDIEVGNVLLSIPLGRTERRVG